MAHIVSIRLSNPDDLAPVASAAARLIGDPFLFALVEEGPNDRSEPDEVHLMLRIDDAEEPEAALAEALEIYRRSRDEAGLSPDANARATVAFWPDLPRPAAGE